VKDSVLQYRTSGVGVEFHRGELENILRQT
jgi:hypothetical protein